MSTVWFFFFLMRPVQYFGRTNCSVLKHLEIAVSVAFLLEGPVAHAHFKGSFPTCIMCPFNLVQNYDPPWAPPHLPEELLISLLPAKQPYRHTCTPLPHACVFTTAAFLHCLRPWKMTGSTFGAWSTLTALFTATCVRRCWWGCASKASAAPVSELFSRGDTSGRRRHALVGLLLSHWFPPLLCKRLQNIIFTVCEGI